MLDDPRNRVKANFISTTATVAKGTDSGDAPRAQNRTGSSDRPRKDGIGEDGQMGGDGLLSQRCQMGKCGAPRKSHSPSSTPDTNLPKANDYNAPGHAPSPTSQTRQPILIILHQASSNPGQIGQWLRASHYPLDIRRPALGDDLPSTLRGFAGTVIFGGPMSAYDNQPFLSKERALIELALRENAPCLGVCLGAQLMAQVLGVEVRLHRDQCAEMGYYSLDATPAGQSFCDRWPRRFYQWHRDGFDLPHGATLLAQRPGGAFPNQAFSYNQTAIGIQFHPEITLAMIHRWTTLAAHRLSLPGAQQREQHLEGHLRYSSQVAKWRACFLRNWLNTMPAKK